MTSKRVFPAGSYCMVCGSTRVYTIEHDKNDGMFKCPKCMFKASHGNGKRTLLLVDGEVKEYHSIRKAMETVTLLTKKQGYVTIRQNKKECDQYFRVLIHHTAREGVWRKTRQKLQQYNLEPDTPVTQAEGSR